MRSRVPSQCSRRSEPIFAGTDGEKNLPRYSALDPARQALPCSLDRTKAPRRWIQQRPGTSRCAIPLQSILLRRTVAAPSSSRARTPSFLRMRQRRWISRNRGNQPRYQPVAPTPPSVVRDGLVGPRSNLQIVGGRRHLGSCATHGYTATRTGGRGRGVTMPIQSGRLDARVLVSVVRGASYHDVDGGSTLGDL